MITASILATVVGGLANSSTAWLVASSAALGIFHFFGADEAAWRYAAGGSALIGIATAWALLCDQFSLDTEA